MNDSYMNTDRVNIRLPFLLISKIDTVDHEILLAKLNFYGLEEKELNWFKSYLQNRRQYCKVNGKVSKTKVVNCAVPQGSCPGPPLFLVYINDIQNCLEKSNVSMYADDTCLYYSADSFDAMNQATNTDLIALRGWLEGSKFSLNISQIIMVSFERGTSHFPGGYMTCRWAGVSRPVFRKLPSSYYQQLPSCQGRTGSSIGARAIRQ